MRLSNFLIRVSFFLNFILLYQNFLLTLQPFYKYFAAALIMFDFYLTLQNYKKVMILPKFFREKCSNFQNCKVKFANFIGILQYNIKIFVNFVNL